MSLTGIEPSVEMLLSFERYPQLEGHRWLARLSELVERCAERWQVSLSGQQLTSGSWGILLSGACGQREVVLKLCPDPVRSSAEAAALRAWRQGAVRLLQDAPGALLLERLQPGTPALELSLSEQASLLAKLQVPAQGIRGLYGRVEEIEKRMRRMTALARKSGEHALLSVATAAASKAVEAPGPEMVCHGDLYPPNILLHDDQPLVVDPHGVAAPPELDVAVCAVHYAPADQLYNGVVCLAQALDLDPDTAVVFARLYAVQEILHHRHIAEQAKQHHLDDLPFWTRYMLEREDGLRELAGRS